MGEHRIDRSERLAFQMGILMVYLWMATALAITFSGCTYPDEVRVGVGHRDEQFANAWDDTDYDGQTAWVEGVWILKPTQVDFSAEARLFLADIQHHVPKDVKPTEVNVNLPEAAKGDIEVITDSLSQSGNWPLWLAVFLILVGAGWLSWRRWIKGSTDHPGVHDGSTPAPTS